MSNLPEINQFQFINDESDLIDNNNFLFPENVQANCISFGNNQNFSLQFSNEEEPINSESVAKDTGVLWIWDGASPTGDYKDTFSTYAQMSSKNDEDNNKLNYGMKNLELNDKMHFSSNSLHYTGQRNLSQTNILNDQLQSSQTLINNIGPSQYFRPWERQSADNMNFHIDVSEFSSESDSFTSIQSVPQVYPKSIIFDFEINEEFKLSQVMSSYFIDSDSEEIVYFWPLADQVVTYNYFWYFNWKIKSMNRLSESYDYLGANINFYDQNDKSTMQYTGPSNSQMNSGSSQFTPSQGFVRSSLGNAKAPRQTQSSLGTHFSAFHSKWIIFYF